MKINNQGVKVTLISTAKMNGAFHDFYMRKKLKRRRCNSLDVQISNKLSAIEQAIYEKRYKLNTCVDAHGLSDIRCLRYSMELDELINVFNRLQKEQTMHLVIHLSKKSRS